MSDTRPNILLIMTDQQCADAMSCAGSDELTTPALDRLAERGTRFQRAYCTQPLCCPSRSSMMTGAMPSEIGVMENRLRCDDALESHGMGRLMARAGYTCGYAGKWHVPENAIPEGVGFEPLCGHNDHEIVPAVQRFLNRGAGIRPGGRRKPFLLVASFDNPHNICEWARHQELPWGNVNVPPAYECPELPANFAIPPYEPEIIRILQNASHDELQGHRFSPDEWRQYRYAYHRLVEKVDAQIGSILDALESAGLADETVVLFTSDHGDGAAHHQWNQKKILYEESIRVPLIAAGPGIRRNQVDTDHLISVGLDLLPTIIDHAEAELPATLRGSSLRPLLTSSSGSHPWRDAVMVQTRFGGPGRATKGDGRALITERYKYIVYSWGRYREQLFDLKNDPGEMVTLSRSARHSETLTTLRNRLAAELSVHNDRFGLRDRAGADYSPVPTGSYRNV